MAERFRSAFLKPAFNILYRLYTYILVLKKKKCQPELIAPKYSSRLSTRTRIFYFLRRLSTTRKNKEISDVIQKKIRLTARRIVEKQNRFRRVGTRRTESTD